MTYFSADSVSRNEIINYNTYCCSLCSAQSELQMTHSSMSAAATAAAAATIEIEAKSNLLTGHGHTSDVHDFYRIVFVDVCTHKKNQQQ